MKDMSPWGRQFVVFQAQPQVLGLFFAHKPRSGTCHCFGAFSRKVLLPIRSPLPARCSRTAGFQVRSWCVAWWQIPIRGTDAVNVKSSYTDHRSLFPFSPRNLKPASCFAVLLFFPFSFFRDFAIKNPANPVNPVQKDLPSALRSLHH